MSKLDIMIFFKNRRYFEKYQEFHQFLSYINIKKKKFDKKKSLKKSLK